MRGIYPSLLPWSAIPCFPILFVLSFYILASLKAQNGYHMEQLSHVKIKEAASSIWGYVHPDGREYALLGTMEGVRIYDLSDPANPVERAFIPGTSSPWRELKTAGDFAYVSTEAGDGLLIIDLRKAPSEFPYRFVHRFYNAAGDSFLIHSAHTLYVDEKNYIYLAGSRPTGPGFVILDPGPDPFQPVLLSYSDEAYHHEVHAFRDLLYGAELYHGVFSIWDISDRQNPRRLSDQPTAKSFTHSVWVEREREILYTADEVEGAVVEAWDVRDPDAIKRTDSYKVLQGASPYIIPHNVFHYRDKLYVSYYTEGMRVLDTKDPENLIEVAYFDTHDQNDRGFHGCWSVYPYYPSGICVASDIENGLFVLQYDGNEPAYLHARISDANDGSPIANARLEIEQNGRIVTEFSNLQGRLKSGFPEADTVLVRVFKKGYHPYSRSVVLDKTNPLEMEIPLVEL
ncbi:MAG TPA: choice-of-anchor B family protein, partial [Saprospiraceae bacterium]|nr:choice-of-anchor B family protein [Saprospiraceae bacterium]